MRIIVVLVYSIPFGVFAWCALRCFALSSAIMQRLEEVDPASHAHVRLPYSRMPLVGELFWMNPGRFVRFLSSGVEDDTLRELIRRYKTYSRIATLAFLAAGLITAFFGIGMFLYG